MDCIFCKIINKEIPAQIVYEDDIVIAFLDVYPDANGHTLLVPKHHFENINDIDQNTLTHINNITKKLYQLYKDKLNATGLTLNQNNDYGQEIKHYHLHLIPRYQNDGYHSFHNKDIILTTDEVYSKLKD